MYSILKFTKSTNQYIFFIFYQNVPKLIYILYLISKYKSKFNIKNGNIIAIKTLYKSKYLLKLLSGLNII